MNKSKNVSNFFVSLFSVFFVVVFAFLLCFFIPIKNSHKVSAADPDIVFGNVKSSGSSGSGSSFLTDFFVINSSSVRSVFHGANSSNRSNVSFSLDDVSTSVDLVFGSDFDYCFFNHDDVKLAICSFGVSSISSFNINFSSSLYVGYPLDFDFDVQLPLGFDDVSSYFLYDFDNGLKLYFINYSPFDSYLVYPDGSLEPSFFQNSSIIDGYIDVWDSVFTWIITSINSVLTLFYLNGELTVFGVLAVVALSIAIFFLCVYLILKFIHFRGN